MEDILLIIMIVIVFIYLNIKNETFQNADNTEENKGLIYPYYIWITDKLLPYSYGSKSTIGSYYTFNNKPNYLMKPSKKRIQQHVRQNNLSINKLIK